MCLQATVRLAVLQSEHVVRRVDCEPAVVAETSQVSVPVQDGTVLECPNLQDATRMAAGEPSVRWLYVKPDNVRPNKTVRQSMLHQAQAQAQVQAQNQNHNVSCMCPTVL